MRVGGQPGAHQAQLVEMLDGHVTAPGPAIARMGIEDRARTVSETREGPGVRRSRGQGLEVGNQTVHQPEGLMSGPLGVGVQDDRGHGMGGAQDAVHPVQQTPQPLQTSAQRRRALVAL